MGELKSIGESIFHYGFIEGEVKGKKELILQLLKEGLCSPSDLFRLSGLTKEEFEALVNETK
ncbi:MAG: hypothetical protein LBE27_05755 [Deltaproteobacteria bacterium]|jgi:hypothetical protein|nr:hypothetical protein [Deltaproteobacteria bacterium]